VLKELFSPHSSPQEILQPVLHVITGTSALILGSAYNQQIGIKVYAPLAKLA